MILTTLTLLAASQLATAHFQLEYPSWRADSLAKGTNYSQWIYPCAGVPDGAPGSNRTDWPTSSGSIKLDLHHPWTYVFVNLGLGDSNVTNFNYTLTAGAMWNETGAGELCLSNLAWPEGLAPADGQKATLQVVTLGDSGSALYNCADITFRSSAKPFGGDTCTNGVNVTVSVVNQEVNGTTSGGSSSGGSSSGSSSSNGTSSGGGGKGSAGSTASVNMAALTSVVGLAVAMVYGVTL